MLLDMLLTIAQAETEEQIAEARTLFREYESWLGLDLCFQGFEEELALLPGKYAAPEGRLLLAGIDSNLAGCIAVRSIGGGICEMKRLYVRDRFRGQRVGVQLIERAIDEARTAGYEQMRLDTFPPKMGKALSLYEARGFIRIPPYYDNPHDGVLFMALSL